MMGVKVEVLKGDWRRAVDPPAVTQRLRADAAHGDQGHPRRPDRHRLGGRHDIAAIRRGSTPPATRPSSWWTVSPRFGCMPFDMERLGIDVAMAGSQKGLMTPPGLAFVAANDRAHATHQKADLRTLYWDWTSGRARRTTRSTAARRREHLLFGLRAAARSAARRGSGSRRPPSRPARRSGATAVDRWAQGQVLAFNVRNAAERRQLGDHGVDAGPRSARAPRLLREKCGVVLGVGIGDMSGKGFRIAHMGHVNAAHGSRHPRAVEMALVRSHPARAPAASRPPSSTSATR